MAYQKESKEDWKIDFGMRKAQREIDRVIYSFELKGKVKVLTFLLVKMIPNQVLEIWHPVLDTVSVRDKFQTRIQFSIYSEVTAEVTLVSLVPLEFAVSIISTEDF